MIGGDLDLLLLNGPYLIRIQRGPLGDLFGLVAQVLSQVSEPPGDGGIGVADCGTSWGVPVVS